MNPLILTKVSKFTLIGSISAFLSFASKANPNVKMFFIYAYVGLVVISLAVILWEGREQITSSVPTEEGFGKLLESMNVASTQKRKRQYLLSPNTRLELVIAIVVVTICAFVGSI